MDAAPIFIRRKTSTMKKYIIKATIASILICVIILASDAKNIMMIKAQGYKAVKAFVQIQSSSLSDFYTYETEHFVIRYSSNDENIVRNVARLFEESYWILNQEYVYAPNGKTLVFIYESKQQMWEYQKVVEGQAIMGFYRMGVLHILSPNTYPENAFDFADYYKNNGPIMHEYAHKLLDDISGGNIEMWLTEGIALYEEYEKLGIEWAPNYCYQRLFSAYEIRNSFMIIDETQAYRQSFDAVSILIHEFGKDKLYELLRLLRKGFNMNQAFLAIYGFSADEFLDTQLEVLLK